MLFHKVKRFVLRDASRPFNVDAWCREYIFGVDLHLKLLNQFSRQVLGSYEILRAELPSQISATSKRSTTPLLVQDFYHQIGIA